MAGGMVIKVSGKRLLPREAEHFGDEAHHLAALRGAQRGEACQEEAPRGKNQAWCTARSADMAAVMVIKVYVAGGARMAGVVVVKVSGKRSGVVRVLSLSLLSFALSLSLSVSLSLSRSLYSLSLFLSLSLSLSHTHAHTRTYCGGNQGLSSEAASCGPLHHTCPKRRGALGWS